MEGGGFGRSLGFFGGEGGGEVLTPMETIAGLSGIGSLVFGQCCPKTLLDSSMMRLDSSDLRRNSIDRASGTWFTVTGGLAIMDGAGGDCIGWVVYIPPLAMTSLGLTTRSSSSSLDMGGL